MTDEILDKQPSESDLFDISFKPKLATGDTVDTIVSTTITPVTVPVLTVAPGVISSPKVQHRISGGLDKTLYKITEIVTTANGNTLETDVFLRVEDR